METALEHILTSTYKDGMISYMNTHPKDFEEAILLAISDKQPYSWRAAWLLWSCMEKNDRRILKHTKSILSAIETSKDSQKRELLHILLKMEINGKYEGPIFDLCITTWENINLQPSARFTAFRIIVKIIKRHPELINEITYLTQNQYLDTLSPGAKHSVSKLLKSLALKDFNG